MPDFGTATLDLKEKRLLDAFSQLVPKLSEFWNKPNYICIVIFRLWQAC